MQKPAVHCSGPAGPRGPHHYLSIVFVIGTRQGSQGFVLGRPEEVPKPSLLGPGGAPQTCFGARGGSQNPTEGRTPVVLPKLRQLVPRAQCTPNLANCKWFVEKKQTALALAFGSSGSCSLDI